jgi:hypothetical protein
MVKLFYFVFYLCVLLLKLWKFNGTCLAIGFVTTFLALEAAWHFTARKINLGQDNKTLSV